MILNTKYHCSPNWEVRHGAALGLREIIKTQGLSGGMKGPQPTLTKYRNIVY